MFPNNLAASCLVAILFGLMQNCEVSVVGVSSIECKANSNCTTADVNSVCDTDNSHCKCKPGYKANASDTSKCIVDDIKMIDCTSGVGNTICTQADPNTVCATNKCKCKAGYKENATDASKCIVVLGSACLNASNCPAESNTHCPATSKKVCTCNQNFTERGGICTANAISNTNNNQNQIVHQAISTTKCTQNGGECKASNSVCDTNVGHCTCSDGFLPSSPVGDTCVKDSAAVTTRFTFSSLGVSVAVFLFLHINY